MTANHQVKARYRTRAGCATIALGSFFGGFGWLFVVAGVSMIWREGTWFGLFFVGIGGLFALGGTAAVGSGIRSLWLARVLGRMTLELPTEQPLGLGGVQVVRFHRDGGLGRAARAPVVEAELTCHESVTYRQGTDDHTVTEELFRAPLTVFPEPGVRGRVEIVVPTEHPPSMALPHNRIVWQVELTVRVTGVPDDASTFAVTVAPELTVRQ